MLEKEFDFIKTLTDTKVSLQNSIVAAQARISMIDEIIQYLQSNNLKVVQEINKPEQYDTEDKTDK